MKTKISLVLALFLSLLTIAYCDGADTATLHPFYEQNGDCYVLIGNGDHRGVWALNNISGGSPEVLYDPAPLEAYGIAAAQKWINNTIEKRIYTFAGIDTGLTSITGQVRPRRIIATYSLGIWTIDTGNPNTTIHNIPPYIVHRYHTWPNSSSTGLGNHGSGQIRGFFEGKCYPCSVKPTYVTTDSEGFKLYNYTVGDGYYHSMDYPIYSPYTYDSHCSAPDLAAAAKADGTYVYASKRFGGFVHYVCKETISEATRNISLYTHRRGLPSNSPYEGSAKYIATVLTKVVGNMKQYGECTDGCIRANPNVTMPGQDSPELDTAYSAFVNRSYLYTRPFGRTDYTLSGATSDDDVIGNGGSLTTKFLGISSKNANGNYVYLLGRDVINNWMTESNCPSSMKIVNSEDLACVAVSDQWWQTGGIVYAYDKRKGKVYSFVRVEVDLDGDGIPDKSGPPDEIDVAFDGIKPDKIACDGFGSLYMLKTEFEPKTTANFGKEGYETERRTVIQGPYTILEAVYKQDVYKTVYERAYDTGAINKIGNRILIGSNVFVKQFETVDGNIDSAWSPVSLLNPLIPVESAGDPNLLRTELAVINCPTPPRPHHLNATTDCVGPMELTGTGFKMKAPGPDGLYTSDTNLFFLVENAPYFDVNNLNIGNADQDVDSDGRIGCFPNTIEKSLTKYYWKIRRTHDREGNSVDKYADENQILATEGDYLLVFPSLLDGKFEVGVKVTYGYYDYSELPVGALASDRDKYPILKGGLIAKGETPAPGHPEDIGYSWQSIGQRLVEPPPPSEGKGVIMAGTNYNSTSSFKPGPRSKGYGCDGCAHVQCKQGSIAFANQPTKFIMDGFSLCKKVEIKNGVPTALYNPASSGSTGAQYAINWGLMLRENSYNYAHGIDRVALMTAVNPPNPNDQSMVPNTLKWLNEDPVTHANRFSVQWRSELKRGNEVVWSKTLVVDNSLSLNLSQIRELMPMPSEPNNYNITASVRTQYTYEYYARIPKYINGSLVGYDTKRIPKIIDIILSGDSEICVTDNFGPGLWQYNAEDNASDRIVPGYAIKYPSGSAGFLKGATGEPLTAYNSGKVTIYVADDNPMANYTGTVSNNFGVQDQYFYNSYHGQFKRLKVSFNRTNKRIGTFHYDTSLGLVPNIFGPYSIEANNHKLLCNTSVTEAELRSVGMVPSLAISYSKYEMPINKISYFTKSNSGVYSANLDYNYANNLSGYNNRCFGLTWSEKCHSLSNPLEISDVNKGFKIGLIVIRDNDRPNCFIKAVQDRYPDKTFISPSGVATNTFWYPAILDDKHSGPENWYVELGGITSLKGWIGDIRSTAFKDLPLTSVVSTLLFTSATPLLTDVPVRFDHVEFDNIANEPKVIVFQLKDKDGNLLKKNFNPKDPIQYVFRNPGIYYVELTVEDDAKNWPSPADAASNPTNAPLWSNVSERRRTTRAYFEVLPTRLDYRVIERSINGE